MCAYCQFRYGGLLIDNEFHAVTGGMFGTPKTLFTWNPGTLEPAVLLQNWSYWLSCV